MKTILFANIILLNSFPLASQNYYDNTWLTGYSYLYYDTVSNVVIGGTVLNFQNNPPEISTVSLATQDVMGIISDRNGNLVAYSDGCRIGDKNHNIMVNGDSLSPGPVFNSYCHALQYPSFQNPIILPRPGVDDQYFVFHVRMKKTPLRATELLYSVIDATIGDAGAVVQKNQLGWADSLLNEFVTATRHANGRDWWVVMPRRTSSGFHVGLLTPEGFEDKGVQSIGLDTLQYAYCCGQTVFSPDGSKYIKHMPHYGVELLDFDRCTGILSNPVYIDFSSDNNGAGNPRGGVIVAPGGRYLYVTTAYHILQYDLWAPDLAASVDTVATWDGFYSPYPTGFFQLALAPNGKIYIVSGSTNDVLHVIHQPDSAGVACQVEQHGFSVPTLTGWSAPNFPNFKLGALAGSPCDTIPPDSTMTSGYYSSGWTDHLLAYPNPATDFLHLIKISGSFGQTGILRVYASTGAVATQRRLESQDSEFALLLDAWPNGMYWWEVLWDDGRKEAGAFVKE